MMVMNVMMMMINMIIMTIDTLTIKHSHRMMTMNPSAKKLASPKGILFNSISTHPLSQTNILWYTFLPEASQKTIKTMTHSLQNTEWVRFNLNQSLSLSLSLSLLCLWHSQTQCQYHQLFCVCGLIFCSIFVSKEHLCKQCGTKIVSSFQNRDF